MLFLMLIGGIAVVALFVLAFVVGLRRRGRTIDTTPRDLRRADDGKNETGEPRSSAWMGPTP